MKGDFTRNTFDPARHYSQVLMQQGRVQVDADWNEQAALTARRDETTAADIVGDCGGPADTAAFSVFTDSNKLTAAETKHLQNLKINKLLGAGDFFLGAGRYYVDGIQCANEWAIPFTAQPDRIDVAALAKNKSYLLYLDVWQRHITELEDSRIRESALGGPDTATRVKTIWQVRALDLGLPGVDPNNPCASGASEFNQLLDPGTALLKADTAKVQAPKDPCQVPPGAGFTGLENQLYRVEIHDPGAAVDAASNVGSAEVTLPGANDPENQITVKTGTWVAGEAVEIYKSKAGSSKMEGQLAWITAVNNKVLTLNIPVRGFVDADDPRLRSVSKPGGPAAGQHATFKWSRENGFVVTRIEKINGQKITVSTLGPDKNLGFSKDTWVEILDDALELEGQPGQLAQVDDVDESGRIITLKSAIVAATFPKGLLPERHPKLRRWEGVAAVKIVADPNTNWLPLESGVQVSFAKGEYRTGHFWQIPARTATAQSPHGDIEWPEDKNNRLALAPRGITHHLCRLGIVKVKNDGSIDATDCRCLWPALTHVPRLFYVSGDGQEVMPDLTDTTNQLYKLPQPLRVGLGNGHCGPPGMKVRFSVFTPSEGLVAKVGDIPVAQVADLPLGADGMANCDFFLDGKNYSQRVRAQLLDAAGVPCSLPIIFNATLSIASEVAYNPAGCEALKTRKTVQAAISGLAALVRIDKVGGDGQDTGPGQPVPNELIVLVSNSCGPVQGAVVTFTAADGFVAKNSGGVSSSTDKTIDITTNANGIAECYWRTANAPTTQQLLAEVAALPAGLGLEARRAVLFTANLRTEGGKGPACDVAVGKGASFTNLGEAIQALLDKKQEQICICLLPGEHDLEGLEFGGQGLTHLHISGCGWGHRIRLNKVLAFAEFASVHLSDLSIITKGGRLVFEQCQKVELSGCYLSGVNDKAPLVQIADASHIKVTDTRIEAHRPDSRPVKVLGSRASLAELFTIPDEGGFRNKAAVQVKELAELSLPTRRSFVTEARLLLRESAPSPDEALAFEKFFAAAAVEAASTALLGESFQGIRDATLRAGSSLALVISGENAMTVLEDNEISGTVSFYGIPVEGGQINENVRAMLASAIKGGALELVDSAGVLQMHHNSVSRVVFGKEMLEQLTAVPTGAVVHIKVYQTFFLSHNVIHEGFNLFLANHLSFVSNRFRFLGDLLGSAVGESAAYIGNSALNDFRLFDISRDFEKAANVAINIVHT